MSSGAGMFAASTHPTRGGKAALSSYEIRGDRQGILGSFFRLVHSSLEICREDLARQALQPARAGEVESSLGEVWLALLGQASDILESFSTAPNGRTLSVIATAEGRDPAVGESVTPLWSGGATVDLRPLMSAVADQEFQTEQSIEKAVVNLVESLPVNTRRTLFYSQFECKHCRKLFETFSPLLMPSPPNSGTVRSRPVSCECGALARFVRGPVVSLPMLQRQEDQAIGPVLTKMGHPAPRGCTQVPPPVEHFLTSVIASKQAAPGGRKRESYCVFVNTASRSDTKVFALYAFANSSLRTRTGSKAGELTFLLRDKFLKFLSDDTQGGVHSAIGTLDILCYMDSDKMRPEAKIRLANQYPAPPPESPPSPAPVVERPLPPEETMSDSASESYETTEESSEPSQEPLPKPPTYAPIPRAEPTPKQEQPRGGCCGGACDGHALLWTAIVILFILIIILAILIGVLFSKLTGTIETDYLLVRRVAVIGYETMDGWRGDYAKAAALPGIKLEGARPGDSSGSAAGGTSGGLPGGVPYPSFIGRLNFQAPAAGDKAVPAAEGPAAAGAASVAGAASAAPGEVVDALPLGAGLRSEADYSLFVRSGFFDHLFAYDSTTVNNGTYFPYLQVGELAADKATIKDLNADNIVADYITFNAQLTQGGRGGIPAVVTDWTVTNQLRAGSHGSAGGYSLDTKPTGVEIATDGINDALTVTGTLTGTRGQFDTLVARDSLSAQGQASIRDLTVENMLTMQDGSQQVFKGSSSIGGETDYLNVTGRGIRVSDTGEYRGGSVHVSTVEADLLTADNANLLAASIGELTARLKTRHIELINAAGATTATLDGALGTGDFGDITAKTATFNTTLSSPGTTTLSGNVRVGSLTVDNTMTAGTCNCGGRG